MPLPSEQLLRDLERQVRDELMRDTTLNGVARAVHAVVTCRARDAAVLVLPQHVDASVRAAAERAHRTSTLSEANQARSLCDAVNDGALGVDAARAVLARLVETRVARARVSVARAAEAELLKFVRAAAQSVADAAEGSRQV